MRLLHTSDWHLGRSLHRFDLRDAHAAHLDHLVEGGSIEEHEASTQRRGRGRPARSYVVSPAGHRALGSDYDHLAGQAVRFLAAAAGPEAVEAFARRERRYGIRVA